MTVKELRDILSSYNDEDEVKVQYQDSGGYYNGAGEIYGVDYDATEMTVIIG